jgi:hypothetical protein
MRGWTRGSIIDEGIEASRQQRMKHGCLMSFSCHDALVPDLMP